MRENFSSLANDLISIRRELSRQIKQEVKAVKALETQLKDSRKSLIRLKKRKKIVNRSIVNLSEIRNDLTFVTFEKVQTPSLSSSDEDSDASSTPEKDKNQVCLFRRKKFHCLTNLGVSEWKLDMRGLQRASKTACAD